jgi:hypothetical protein
MRTDAIHIVGPLYFVGTRSLSSWLFVTSEGNILLNTGTSKSGPMIIQSIKTLGFKPEDIKIIINGHGHLDHAGAFAYMKQLTGAQVAVMQEDVAMVEEGGKSDFCYGKDWQVMGQPTVKVDRVLRDGDIVRLGEVILTAYHTPGVGPLISTAVVSAIGNGAAFKKGREFAAWLGLVPRRWSTGGKSKLLGISKRGNPYLRKMFIHGARAAVLRVKREGSTLGKWMSGLETRAARNVVIVATANKLARISWAVLASGNDYQPMHRAAVFSN